MKDSAELKAAFGRLKRSGENLLGDDGEGTTDGSHPNDLGFARQAEIFAKVLKPLLQPGKIK